MSHAPDERLTSDHVPVKYGEVSKHDIKWDHQLTQEVSGCYDFGVVPTNQSTFVRQIYTMPRLACHTAHTDRSSQSKPNTGPIEYHVNRTPIHTTAVNPTPCTLLEMRPWRPLGLTLAYRNQTARAGRDYKTPVLLACWSARPDVRTGRQWFRLIESHRR